MGFWAVTTFNASRWSNPETRTGLGGHLGAPWPHVPLPLQPPPRVCTLAAMALEILPQSGAFPLYPKLTDLAGKQQGRSHFLGVPNHRRVPTFTATPTPQKRSRTPRVPHGTQPLLGTRCSQQGAGGPPAPLTQPWGPPGDPTSGGGHPSPSPRCKARGEAAASAPHPRQETTAEQFCFNCKKKKKKITQNPSLCFPITATGQL